MHWCAAAPSSRLEAARLPRVPRPGREKPPTPLAHDPRARHDPPPGGVVRACLRGDQDAWETLVRSHAGLVYAVIRRCGFDGDEAADLFQEVWLDARRQLGTVHDERRLAGWLAALAARRAKWALGRRGQPTHVGGRPPLVLLRSRAPADAAP